MMETKRSPMELKARKKINYTRKKELDEPAPAKKPTHVITSETMSR